MFWKTEVKNQPERSWSITNKLTNLYTCAIFGIFIIIALVLYFLLFKLIHTAEKQYLIDEIHILRTLLQQHSSDLRSLSQEVNAVPAALKNASYHYYVKILDNQNNLLMQTPQMDKLHINNFPTITNSWEKTIHYSSNELGQKYMLMTGPIAFDNRGNVSKVAQIALDVSFQEQLIKKYRNYIVILLLLVVASTFLLSRAITKRGLRRLYDLVKMTENIIKPPFLQSQINIIDWPKELTPVGIAYNNMVKRLDDTFSRLSHSISELAHELRTPINNLMGEAELVLNKPRTSVEYEKVINSSLEEYSRLSTVIDNILFLARTDNPSTVLQKQKLNAYPEISKIAEYCELAASEKGIEIEISGEAEVWADKDLFYRTIYNLLDNALKHCRQNGKVLVNFMQCNEWSIIKIADTGRGIEEKHLQFIFEPFYRIKDINNAHEKTLGLGLGLSIVKSIMNLHEGKIEVQSEVNVGTTFSLYYPVVN